MNLISNLWFPPPKSMKMRRGFQKPHQTFKLKFPSRIWLIFVAKDSWLPYWNCDGVSGNHITFLDAQPRIFGDQSRFGGYSQRYLATNHVLGSIAKDICRPIMFCLTWPPKKTKKTVTGIQTRKPLLKELVMLLKHGTRKCRCHFLPNPQPQARAVE